MKRALMVGFVFTVVLALGLVGGSSYASADPGDINVWTPVDSTWDDTLCSGEPVVHFTGMMHSVIHSSVTPTGGIHFNSVDNYADVKGVGMTTGISYVVQDNAHDILNIDGPNLDSMTSDHFRIVSIGAPPNFFLFVTTHFVINSSGVTASADPPRTGCSG
jgi:hypothetical protein